MDNNDIIKKLIGIAEKEGYAVVGVPYSVESGCVIRDEFLIKVGTATEGVSYADIKAIAVLAHEVGHVKTFSSKRSNLMLTSFWGACNKYVLHNELRASSWAIRFLRKCRVKEIGIVKTFLKECYGTYREGYDRSGDDLELIRTIKERSIN